MCWIIWIPGIAWDAPADALQAAGLPQKSVEYLINLRNQVNLDEVSDHIEKMGIQVVTWEDDHTPGG